MLLSCCERLTDFFISQCGLSETRRPWYIYTLQTRISMFLSTAGMMLLGCLVATPYQVICFLVGILSLRRRLGGYHAKTPLRCLFLSIGVSILCLSIVNSLVQYSLSILIWILFISLSFAVFNSSPYSHPNCPLTPDELAVSWIKAKHILIWNLFLILLLQIFFANSNCALYCEMGIIAAAISFFVSKFKEVKSSLSEKPAGKLDDLTRCDMREWPPTSIPICYQPQHPQRETDNTDK